MVRGSSPFALAADYGGIIVVFPYRIDYGRPCAGSVCPASGGFYVAALSLVWLITTWKDMSGAGLFAYAGRLAGDLSTVVSKSLNVLFNFWFVEPFALAVTVFGGVWSLSIS